MPRRRSQAGKPGRSAPARKRRRAVFALAVAIVSVGALAIVLARGGSSDKVDGGRQARAGSDAQRQHSKELIGFARSIELTPEQQQVKRAALRSEGEWEPEVELTLRLTHRHGYLGPVDDCEKRCAEQIQAGLKKLGVQPRSWSAARATQP